MTDETPPPPSTPEEPDAQSEPADSTQPAPPTSEERTMAMLCHLLAIFTWVLAPLIIWLLKKEESSFIDDQGKEALNFQITIAIAYAVGVVLSCIGVGFLLILAVWVVDIVFCILATVAANRGERYRYPLSIRLVK